MSEITGLRQYLTSALASYRRSASMIVLSAGLLGLVGYASDETIGLFYVSLLAVILLVTCFHALFGSKSSFFNIVFANAITIYLCFFTFFVESLFPSLAWRYIATGFMLPLVGFLAGAVYKRHEIRGIIGSKRYIKEAEFLRSFLWLIPITMIGVFAFIIHEAHLTVPLHDVPAAFLAEMGMIAFIVFFASRDFTLMMIDTGVIFSNFFVSNARLIKPAFAFFTFYSLNIIVFATLYRIIEHLSSVHNFMISGVARDLTFVESMYFSMVTVSTLGFGDIVPITNAVRFLVGLQSFFGMMLFLFGVHAFLEHGRDASVLDRYQPHEKDDNDAGPQE